MRRSLRSINIILVVIIVGLAIIGVSFSQIHTQTFIQPPEANMIGYQVKTADLSFQVSNGGLTLLDLNSGSVVTIPIATDRSLTEIFANWTKLANQELVPPTDCVEAELIERNLEGEKEIFKVNCHDSSEE